MSLEQEATPDRLSPHMKCTVTSALYQLLAFGSRSGAALMVGGVLSMLTVATSVAVLPALSTALPCTGWFWPSVVTVCGVVQLAMPDCPACLSHRNVTLTSVLFQP